MVYVVWLHNKVDSKDDEWTKITATNKKEALKRLTAHSADLDRFTLGKVYTVKEFEKDHGKGLLG
jgi:hypothetical protein